jgi:hypothetical protein
MFDCLITPSRKLSIGIRAKPSKKSLTTWRGDVEEWG